MSRGNDEIWYSKYMKRIELPNFKKTEQYVPRTTKEKALIEAFVSIRDSDDIAFFLRDLLTSAELDEFANRLEIAKKLLTGISYVQIAKETKVSTTTVTRVAHWLFKGCGGYWKVLKKV